MTTARQSLVLGACALLALAVSAAAEPMLPTFEARYEVRYKGRKLGQSEHSVTYDAERDVYRFESVTTARGLARLLRPRPAIERSEFRLSEDTIKPYEYSFEDGSRSGRDNVRIEFHWQDRRAAVTSAEGSSEIALAPGVLDRASLQIELMRALAAGEPPGPYILADGDSLKTYRYTVEGRDTLETASSTYETVRLRQSREGSSRETLIWTAPALGYLPVRIEQRRDGEALTTLTLDAVGGL